MARKTGIEIEVDRLTNSIVNVISGDVLETEFHKLGKNEIKKTDWLFKWNEELANKSVHVYKMTIKDNPTVVQGLISYSIDNKFIFVNMVENAKFNRGVEKVYEGVGGNLFAFACKRSLELGFEGFVSFNAKTSLIDYYKKTLGAEVMFGQRMAITDISAKKLINQYFKK